MPPEPTTIGALTLAGITLLGGVLLVLRLREQIASPQNAKPLFATQDDLHKLRDEFTAQQRETRAEHADLHRLIRQNAEHIAALIAQSEFYNQRINELSVKFDHLHTRQT